MLRYLKQSALRLPIPIAAVAGLAVAALVGVAMARTFTLQIAKGAKVTNTAGMTTTEAIVVNTRGHAVYTLSGDSKSHPKCTKANGCVQFWPPVTVSSIKRLSKAPGIKGKLGVWNHNGMHQVTLAGHPLYTFFQDHAKHVATGQGLQSFGGTWRVVKPSRTSSTSTTSTTTSTATSTSTTTTSCLYPPCY